MFAKSSNVEPVLIGWVGWGPPWCLGGLVPPLITRGGAASHSATCSTCSTDHLRCLLISWDSANPIIWLDPDAPTGVGSKWRMARLAALWVVNSFDDDDDKAGSKAAFLPLSIQHCCCYWGTATSVMAWHGMAWHGKSWVLKMVTWRFVEMQLPVEVSLSNTYFSLEMVTVVAMQLEKTQT